MRKFIAALIGAATLATSLPASAEMLPRPALPDVQKAYPNESYSQYYYRRGYYYGRPYYGRPYYRHNNGAAVAAGVAGIAAGALIAGAIANSAQAQPAAPPPPGTVSPSVAAYCAKKYRSYDPVTGTFLAHNGMRYVCTYP
ncbi:BA14K family protein [Microvirga sp. 17 mud 1-3]|uniref:BA14K family protein n=1 Tax=Microvirga sp. 17 mud 1-3 TaxID=2082949 RepID=UPI000D6AC3E6|nr:BA14K family protein [Microvirga sp. 17 mud 1-3]AWM86998.1 hypothetical protein C4E04_09815 [Microvirga sp. 17 mud 1-3]